MTPLLHFDDRDQASQWDSWKNQFNSFLKAIKKIKEDEDVQASVLITYLGLEGAKIYDSLVFTDQEDKLKINPVLAQFDNHFRPQKSETFERFKINFFFKLTAAQRSNRDSSL